MDFRQLALAKLGGLSRPGMVAGGQSSPTNRNAPGAVNSNTPTPSRFPPVGSQRTQAPIGKVGQPTDPRGLLGMFLRGRNVYPGGLPNAHAGSNINMGRPKDDIRSQALRRVRGNPYT